MGVDKAQVIDMNRRILGDLQKVESDRTAQIKKLVFSYAQALADNSSRVFHVFTDTNNDGRQDEVDLGASSSNNRR